ncbi:hypothetical protein AQI88_39420 [Streptomyces cellostaticus]|uniref:Uncharacterized protein n=1 Tax=Streptomyces cellostaticus TaxID=67285 RepID=A0A117PSR8_9ACTN|nr:hypothetical protein AQI88_39420 [Streptomyces cellostaticus]
MRPVFRLPTTDWQQQLERITARRAELDELEEQLAKQLAEIRAERDELAVAGTGPLTGNFTLAKALCRQWVHSPWWRAWCRWSLGVVP